ncbi:hypothetical protein OAA89_00410 [bacterium]|nr:hypothetical protein [bacterium]
MSRRDHWISESKAAHTGRGHIITIESSVIVIATLIALLFGSFGPPMIFIGMMVSIFVGLLIGISRLLNTVSTQLDVQQAISLDILESIEKNNNK